MDIRKILIFLSLFGFTTFLHAYDRDAETIMGWFMQRTFDIRQFNAEGWTIYNNNIWETSILNDIILTNISVDAGLKDITEFGIGVRVYSENFFDISAPNISELYGYASIVEPFKLPLNLSFGYSLRAVQNVWLESTGYVTEISWDPDTNQYSVTKLNIFGKLQLNWERFRFDSLLADTIGRYGSLVSYAMPSLHLFQDRFAMATRLYSGYEKLFSLEQRLRLGNDVTADPGHVNLYLEGRLDANHDLSDFSVLYNSIADWRYFEKIGANITFTGARTYPLYVNAYAETWFEARYGLGWGISLKTNLISLIDMIFFNFDGFIRYNDFISVPVAGNKPDWCVGICVTMVAGLYKEKVY